MKIATLETKIQKNDSGKIQGIANSLTMTRSGIRVTQDAGKKVVGKVVPLLMGHDWTQPSIGRVVMTNVDQDGLHYEATLYDDAEKRNLLLQGVEGGTNYVSIGFGLDNIDEDGNIDSIDLLELSLTSVPADPKATAEIVKQAIEKEEDDNMEDDNKEATIQDVLDAVATLQKDFDDFKESQKSADKPDDKTPTDDGDKDKETEVQSLKDQIKVLESFMPAVDRRSLSLNDEMTFDRLHY